jgi:hypothetical protein
MASNPAAGFGGNREGTLRQAGRTSQDQASVRDLYGQAKEGAGEAIGALEQIPGSLEEAMRNWLRARPFTAAAVLLGFGWLAGRLHRPF